MSIKLGSRVRCVARYDEDPVQIGDCGTVLETDDTPFIRWDTPREGTYLWNGHLNVWAMTFEELELLP